MFSENSIKALHVLSIKNVYLIPMFPQLSLFDAEYWHRSVLSHMKQSHRITFLPSISRITDQWFEFICSTEAIHLRASDLNSQSFRPIGITSIKHRNTLIHLVNKWCSFSVRTNVLFSNLFTLVFIFYVNNGTVYNVICCKV